VTTKMTIELNYRKPITMTSISLISLYISVGLLLSVQDNVVFACPKECVCQGHSVDCSSRELLRIPSDIPKITERL
jgi:hypothetical protein